MFYPKCSIHSPYRMELQNFIVAGPGKTTTCLAKWSPKISSTLTLVHVQHSLQHSPYLYVCVLVFHDGSSLSCFLYLYLLHGGASLGILSGSSLISPFSSLFTPFLPSSPSAWAYCPARPSSLPSSYFLFHFLLYFSLLFALLPPFLSTGVCPKRLRPMWQHLMTQSGL